MWASQIALMYILFPFDRPVFVGCMCQNLHMSIVVLTVHCVCRANIKPFFYRIIIALESQRFLLKQSLEK